MGFRPSTSTNNNPPTSVIDQLLGEAYDTVKLAVENIAVFQEAAANLDAYEEITDSIENVNAVAASLTELNNLHANLSAFLTANSNAASVTAVAGSIANVNAVSAELVKLDTLHDNLPALLNASEISEDIAAVAANLDSINQVLAAVENINSVYDSLSSIEAITGDLETIQTVHANLTALNSIATNLTALLSLEGNSAAILALETEITALGAITSAISAVAANTVNINTVAGMGSNISSVLAISSDIAAVVGNSAAITTVAGLEEEILAVPALAEAADNSATVAAAEAASVSVRIYTSAEELGEAEIPENVETVFVAGLGFERITEDYWGLGPEILVNGDLSSATGWSVNTGWTVSGGVGTHAAGNTGSLGQVGAAAAGGIYQMKMEVVSVSAGSVAMWAGTGQGTSRTAAGTYTEIKAQAGDTLFRIAPSSDFVGSVDNVSFKRLPDNSIQDGNGTWWGPQRHTLPNTGSGDAGKLLYVAPGEVGYVKGPGIPAPGTPGDVITVNPAGDGYILAARAAPTTAEVDAAGAMMNSDILNQNDLATASTTRPPSQSSVKSYVGNYVETCIALAVSDEETPIETGTSKVTFHMPYAFTLTQLPFAGLSVVQASGSLVTVDINKNGASIFSTRITINNAAYTSISPTTPAVLSVTTFAKGDRVTIDIDQVGNGSAKGLKVYLIGRRTG